MIVEHFGSDKLQPIAPVKNASYWVKPKRGGLWTSPVDSCFSWKDWCISESFNLGNLERSFKLDITVDNMLLIDSYKDLEEKMVNTHLMKIVHQGVGEVDFETMSLHYDGMWLTMNGQEETRFARPFHLYGWDCETVLLFNEKPIVGVVL